MSGDERETEREPATDELKEEQESRGYGEDERERDEALEQRNYEAL